MGPAEAGQAPSATRALWMVCQWSSIHALPSPDVRPPALAPGSSPLWSFPASGSGGIEGANALPKGCCLLPLHLSTLRFLGEAEDRVPGPPFTQVQVPQSRDWSPLASGNTGCVRACVQVWVCVCVFLLVSLGNLGVGLEVVGDGTSSSLSPSGERNQEVRPVGPPIWGISVLAKVGLLCPQMSEMLEDLCFFPTPGLFPAMR